MKVEYDDAKRQLTLTRRGLDFEAIVDVFAGRNFRRVDDRKDYGEVRYVTTGVLNERVVVCVWTERDEAVRVISMRVADDEERKLYWRSVDRSR